MTINEAIKEIQGKPAGITGRATVNYAEEQLFDGEKVFAAAPANIFLPARPPSALTAATAVSSPAKNSSKLSVG